jgi:hypothetical protein
VQSSNPAATREALCLGHGDDGARFEVEEGA